MSDNATEHESFIKTPQQLIVVGLLAFTVPVIMIIMFAQFVISASKPEDSKAGAEAVAARGRFHNPRDRWTRPWPASRPCP